MTGSCGCDYMKSVARALHGCQSRHCPRKAEEGRRVRRSGGCGTGGRGFADVQSVSASGLGFVEALIGPAGEVVEAFPVGMLRAAEAAGHGKSVRVRKERGAGYERAQLFPDCGELLRVRLRQDDQKLLPAPAAEDVVGADTVSDPVRDFAQNGVADIVSVGVVDRFEMVDIEHDDRKRGSGAGGQIVNVFQKFLAMTSVEDPGQFVGLGEHLEGVRKLANFLQEFVSAVFGKKGNGAFGKECDEEPFFELIRVIVLFERHVRDIKIYDYQEKH